MICSMNPPVSMHKCGEVDAVDGARAPVGKTDGTSPEDLWKGKNTILHVFLFLFCARILFLFVSDILHFSLPLSSFLPGPRDKRKHCWCKANQVAGSPPL